MAQFLLKRLVISVFVFFAVTFLVYLLSSLAPGSPVDQYITVETTEDDIAILRESMGLDKPIPVQYLKWLTRMVKGDFGKSYRIKTPVITLIRNALPYTIGIASTSMILALLIAVPLGAISAYKPYSIWDHIASVLSFLGTAIPNFFIGLVFIYFFSVRLGILPSSGLHSKNGTGLFDLVWHLIQPVLIVAIRVTGIYIKQIRGSMLEVMNEEFIKMARAKGLRERKILFGYVIRNASIPMLTAIGLSIPAMLSGSVIVEQLFALPGLGQLLTHAVQARDYPIIMAVAMFISLVVLVLNLLLDILYGFLDPRIRYK
jgi:peptide/nickel transport system permease protein